jgi:hypothetical protein
MTVLRESQGRFGDPPRSLSLKEKMRFRIWPPLWCLRAFDPLLRIYADQNKLRDRGRIVWGHIVQANRLLFQPGEHTSPAGIIYEPGPPGADSPARLAPIAQAIFDLKGRRYQDQELDECARRVTNERSRFFAVPVPMRLTGGRSVLFSVIMVHRKHLPRGYLDNPFVPVLINPEETPTVMILPHDYWADGVEELGT